MACPDPSDVHAFVERKLAGAAAQAIEEHLEACDHCRGVVMALARAQRETSAEERADTAPAASDRVPKLEGAIGRYLLSRVVGAGGMGVVYAAWDPQLERKVAVKLLRPDPSVAAEVMRARLLREAQAMARLSHPNVITVYEVGAVGDQVFVAMEYIDGGTLGAWLRERPRSWREIVAAFVAAGEGLSAAHQAGLIHRDFKPDNVLVGRDGRIVVTDFGLARALSDATDEGGRGEAVAQSPLGEPLTRTGMLVGTPAYMAPEQLEAGITDERSDLFSFCVALYEALFGQRPFPGASVEEVRHAMKVGLRPAPRAAVAPRWVLKLVAQGLAVDPAARPPSLRRLVDALGDDPRQRWLKRVGVTAFVLMALTSAGLTFERTRAQRHRCDGGAARVATIWSLPRRQAVEAALTAAGRAASIDAAPLAASVGARVDRWAAGWIAMYRDACEATRVRNEQSEALLDARMQCLDDRLGDLRALTAALAGADAQSVSHAADAVGSLPSVNECGAGEPVQAHTRLPSDPKQRAEVEAFRARLAEARVLYATGKADALPAASALLALPGAARDAQGSAKALTLLGLAQDRVGHFDEAERALREAARRALAAGDAAATASAWIALGSLIGDNRMQTDDGLRWLDLAGALVSRLPDRSDLELDRLLAIGAVMGAADRWAAAEETTLRAVALAEKICAADEPNLARAYDLLSGVQAQDPNQLASAAASGQRAVAVLEKAGLGGTTNYAMMVYNLALTYESMERYDETIELTKRALAINERLLPADSSRIFDDRLTLGSALVWQRRFAEAERVLLRILPDIERHRQEMPHQIPQIWMHLAQARAGLGHPGEAIKLYERALADPNLYDGGDRATVEIGLATALWDSGRDRPRARQLAERAKASLNKTKLVSRLVARDVESWGATHR